MADLGESFHDTPCGPSSANHLHHHGERCHPPTTDLIIAQSGGIFDTGLDEVRHHHARATNRRRVVVSGR